MQSWNFNIVSKSDTSSCDSCYTSTLSSNSSFDSIGCWSWRKILLKEEVWKKELNKFDTILPMNLALCIPDKERNLYTRNQKVFKYLAQYKKISSKFSLFCPALSSVHETFPAVSWCHTLFAPKVVCPKSCTKLYQEREKVPSLENASTTPMSWIIPHFYSPHKWCWSSQISWLFLNFKKIKKNLGGIFTVFLGH